MRRGSFGGMSRPALTVIVTVYNGRKFLRSAILSLIHEKIQNLEIIVIDDASTDGSANTIKDFPVRIIRHSKNLGGAAAQNTGVHFSRGTYITFLDSDDLLAPGGLRWRLNYLKRNTSQRIVGGRPAAIVDGKGKERPEFQHLFHPDFRPPKKLSLDFYKTGGLYPTPNWLFMYRRSLLEEVGPFNPKLRVAYDVDHLFRVLEITSVPIVFKPVVYRRLHDHNVSHSTQKGVRVLSLTNKRINRSVLRRFGIFPKKWDLWESGYSTQRTI